MTTYTWSPNTLTAAWTDARQWTVLGAPVGRFPAYGDTAIIGAGTVELGLAVNAMSVTLQPVAHATGVVLAATGVDLGDGAVLVTRPPAALVQSIVYDVIGTGTLDDTPAAGHAASGRPGSIDFSAASLTLELSADPNGPGTTASFVNAGAISGGNLTLAAGSGAATPSVATFVNNTSLDITGALLQSAGVTLGGTGEVLLDGIAAAATLEGAVLAGQSIAFANVPADGELRGGVTLGDLAQFQGSIALDHEHRVVVLNETSGVRGYANGVLTFVDNATLDIAPVGDASTIVTQVVTYSHETLIDAACFLAGTRIATARGDIPAEAVRPGDSVRLARGGLAPVVWVGARQVDCARHPRPHDVWPVRVCAGAIAEGVPGRDLWLSPDHAIAVAGALVPVRHLLNGATILQERAARARYCHIELARHDLVLAEGLACESYLDTGNRAAFEGGGPALALHADFARAVWAAAGCAPLVGAGPALALARLAVLRRAARLGHRRTGDPGLRLLCDGRAVPLQTDGAIWQARLPPGAQLVRLCSRVWVPAHMRAGESDARALGVAIGRLWLDGREAGLDGGAFAEGWHAAEAALRWSDGQGGLHVGGVLLLRWQIAMAGTYWRAGRETARPGALPLDPSKGKAFAIHS